MILKNSSDLKFHAKRIISLVPSQTELLWYLGLEEEVIGITKFCIHPAHWFKTKKRIGGTKQLDIKEIINLQPDLIIANKEENEKEQIEQLAQHCDVWVTDVNDLDDAYEMIANIGTLTNKESEAIGLIREIEAKFSKLDKIKKNSEGKVIYLIWQDPFMTVGGDTFISAMIEKAGYENCYESGTRYPKITMDDIRNSGCKTLLLSTEPYPFTAKHISKFHAELPGINVRIVDGEMFSWYGCRLLQAPQYFSDMN